MRRTVLASIVLALVVGAAIVAQSASRSTAAPTPEGSLTALEPYPDSIYDDWGSATDAIEQRVRDWYVAVNVGGMSVEEIEAGISEITTTIANRPDNPEGELLWLRELVLRREALCQSLPAGHAYRAGEYCSSTSAPGFTIASGG